jgi:general secretion pathway protein C
VLPTLTSPSTVWAAALVIVCIWFWYVDSPSPPPEVAASEPTRADPEPILASAAPAPGPHASVPPGAETRQPAAVSRYQLSGVLASTAAGGPGIALIAVDGAAARAVRVGAPVDGDLVLKDVSQGGAALGPANGPATVMLEVNYGANQTSPVQLASAWRTPASFGAQASPSVDFDPASQPAVVAAYSHRPRRSPVAMQSMAPP